MMKRYGRVIKLKADKVDEYRRLHLEVWPEVLKIIKKIVIMTINTVPSFVKNVMICCSPMQKFVCLIKKWPIYSVIE